jgi:ligand-binding sensor domain-containing protein
MSSSRSRRTKHRQYALTALSLVAALSACAAGQVKGPPTESAPKADGNHPKPTAAKGETVSELDKAIMYVFQAKNHDYWFGSDDRGVYRYDGKNLVNFTTRDGLVSNHIKGIQEDKVGTIYFTTYAGISKFDGQAFTTLNELAPSAATDWKLRPDDLWFVGGQDTGAVFRFDGDSLHRLEFPRTKAGDEHLARYPRSEFPNAKYSPYDVYCIFKDSNGYLWFGTALLGACRYDGKSFAWIPEDDLRNGSFGTRSIIEDKNGKFWFSNALHRYAVDLSDSAKPSFRKEEGIRDADDPNKLPFGGIMSSTVDSEGVLWIATYGEGVWRHDGKSTTHYPVTSGDKAITLFTISKDVQGNLWLGTHNEGAYRFNGNTFEKFRP